MIVYSSNISRVDDWIQLWYLQSKLIDWTLLRCLQSRWIDCTQFRYLKVDTKKLSLTFASEIWNRNYFCIYCLKKFKLPEFKSSNSSLIISSVWKSGSNTGLFSTVFCISVFSTSKHKFIQAVNIFLSYPPTIEKCLLKPFQAFILWSLF